ncbi:hypothetical protein KXR53_19110 [Inquilinus limosus]|uniref:four-carbon acid sugar kinase family protein n=1 Tax=Inquilinus limosus TaxID=171674 RepID=UPI003F14F83B
MRLVNLSSSSQGSTDNQLIWNALWCTVRIEIVRCQPFRMLDTRQPSARPQLAIIADDLTGALDAAAPFAGRGLATIVVADLADLGPALAEAPDILSVSTQSRELAPDAAAERVARVAGALPAGLRLFKKIDSRLKGNIEAELSALPAERLLVLPAIPEFGRIVRDGSLSGFGVDTPIPVAAALGRHAGRSTVPDTLSGEDMAGALAAADGALLVGARGLAEALAGMLSDTLVACAVPPGMRLSMVVGSRDPITLAQVNALREGHSGLCYIPAPNGDAPAHSVWEEAGRLTLLQAVPGDAPATGEAVVSALAESLCRTCLNGRTMLLLTGGATAAKVLARLGIGRVRLSGEVLPGMPLARAGGFVLITKSGGFGSTEALKLIADAVCGG